MNIKKFASTFLILVLSLAAALSLNYAFADWTPPNHSAPECTAGDPGCDPPVNVSSVAQVKNGSLSVNAFTAYMNAIFKQDVSLDRFKVPLDSGVTAPISAGSERNVCADKNGKLVPCDGSSSSSSGPCPSLSGSGTYTTNSDCAAQVEYYMNASSNPSYTSAGTNNICVNDGWKDFGSMIGSGVNVVNNSTQDRNYLVIGQAFVGNDGGGDTIAYMLKDGSSVPSPNDSTGIIGFDQIVIDDSPTDNPDGRPSGLKVISVETVPAGATRFYHGWIRTVGGGTCARVFGMKASAIPL